jgi:hypothetical protein
MSTSSSEISCGSIQGPGSVARTGPKWNRNSAWPVRSTGAWRETSLNWLALGLLLAAWNASDDDSATQAARRPEGLRGYSSVSVRAAMLHSGKFCKQIFFPE